MEMARNTLREAGIQVVPRETVNWVMDQLKLAKDGMSISCDHTDEEGNSIFAKSWVACIHAAASDPAWGRLPDSVAPAMSDLVATATTASSGSLGELDPSFAEFLEDQ